MLVSVCGGDTLLLEWKSAGTVVSSIGYEVIDAGGLVIATGSLSDTGAAGWLGYYTVPTGPAYFTVKTTAVITGRNYCREASFRIVDKGAAP